MDNKMILKELHSLLNERFPGLIEKIILFGSRVCGNADINSDYDVLILLKTHYNWRLKQAIQDTCWELDYKYDILTDVKLISLAEMQTIRGKQPYITNALQYGMAL
ncbi:MAG: nucleotidyltransferase domain-containing protein [bacterium]|nr:nucleotidyltransferase domain-containing protein [bacterium]